MIRTDKTSYRADNDENNWTNRMYQNDKNRNPQQELQNDLLKSWDSMEQKRARGENVKEWDLAQRIAAASPTENHWTRYDRLAKEAKERKEKEDKLYEAMTKRMNAGGQSVEEFDEEIKKLREEIRRIAK